MASPSFDEHAASATLVEAAALSNRQQHDAVEQERQTSPRNGGQDDSIRELLATANTRQDTFQEIRESSFAAPSVRDDRKCDYPLQPIPRVASGRRSSGSRRGSHVALLQPPVENPRVGVEARVAVSSEMEYLVWRRDLQAHVAHVLMELRLRPLDLQAFLASHYPKTEGVEDDDEDSSDDDDQATGSEQTVAVKQPSTSIHDISPVQLQRHVRKFLSVQGVYKKLMEIGMQLGEALYLRLRSMLLKSVTHGVLDRASNVVRLESMFKLELRRHVTIETLRDEVEAKQAQYQKTKRQQQLSRSKRRAATNDAQGAESESTSGQRHHHGSEDGDVAHDAAVMVGASGTVSSAHDFKLQALERVLDNARRRGGSSTASQDVVVVVPLRSGHDQLDEHLHERITSALYSKNRDNFPFWKDPPENGLSREETAKVLRAVVSVLLALPAFRTLTVDQVLEMARGTRWRIAGQGHAVAVKNHVVDQLLIVMEGRVAAESTTESVQSQAQLLQPQRTADNPLETSRECMGEMGLLSKTELWPSTLRVVSSQAKILVLSRDAFDAALLKIFGGFKRQSQLLVNGMKRPTSSPAGASRLLLTRRSISGSGGLVVGTPRPMTAAPAREQAVAKFRQFRDEQLARVDETASRGNDPVGEQETKSDTSHLVPRGDRPRRPMRTSSVYQHYPSFPASSSFSSSTTTSSAGSHLFRLKCIQPIAFGMKSMEELIHDEWAPAFPDTGTLVDYLATAETNFLFEKRNVLLKANLRAVCTNLPFQGGEDRGGARSADEISTSDHLQGGDAAFTEPVSPTNAAALAGNSSPPMNTPPAILTTGDSDSMTLGQFTEARKRIFGKHGSSFKGAASPSMRNLLASSATSATLAKNGHAPFTNSSFVPEASFTNDLRLKKPMESNEEEEEEEDGGEDEEMEQILEEQAQNRRKSSVMIRPVSRPEVDDDDDDDNSDGGSSSASDVHALSPIDVDSPTRARKSALDSLVQSMASPSKKQSIVDQEAARRIILQKHLYAANQGPPSSSSRRKSSVASAVAAGGAGDATTTTMGSHAPLPLRVDLQRRMEVVLAALKMKPKTKLDLVLKYTHADFYDRFPDAVVLWEQALHYIQKREKALEALRQFELVASDPRRHFRSLSTHRLTEQKERDSLFYQLNYASDLCRESLEELEKRCDDVVYFESRVYRDKIKKDYTELLFDVEQERLRMIYKGVHPSVTPTTNGSGSSVNGHHAAGGGSSQPLQVALSGSGRSTSKRYALTTPRESIYTSVVTREQQDAREEQERERAAQAEAAANQKPSHNLSARVKMHRQAQLDATSAKHSLPGNTPREQQQQFQKPERPKQGTANQRETQVRAASGVEPISSITSSTTGLVDGKMNALKNAIESALGRR